MEADDPQCSDIRVEAPCEEKVSCQAEGKEVTCANGGKQSKMVARKKRCELKQSKIGWQLNWTIWD